MDQYQNTFQMLGQNMFSKGPPSGYNAGYHPLIQANSNKQKFDQLIQLMQQQEQTVSDYNTRMKEKEDHLYYLEQQSMQLQRELIQKDKQRNEHNQIHYKNYQPTFNVQNNVAIEPLQTDLQQVQNLKQNKPIQAVDFPEIQSQQMQRKASVQSNQTQIRPQSNAIQGNQKLLNMQKQIEEQNEYIQQLSALVGNRKPVFDPEKDDSLAQLMNERDDLQKQHILNEIKQLKQRIDDYDYTRQQMIHQPFQQYGFIPQQQQQLLQQQGMMQVQNPYGMYPQIYPPNIQLQQQQQQSDESDDNDLNNEILMKLIDQQNRQKRRGSRNKQNSHDNKDRNQKRDRKSTQKRKKQDDDNNDGNDNGNDNE